MEGLTGYPLDWFLSKPTDDFKCQSCNKVSNDPHQCKNGHVFCLKCLQTCTECPTCNVSVNQLELARNLFVGKMIAETLTVKCPCQTSAVKSDDDVCDWSGSISERFKRRCIFESLPCINDGCFEIVQRQFMDEHCKLHSTTWIFTTS
jgi:hypothetical protein